MSHVGYARDSSTGQSLEVQLDKLQRAGCDRIYQEKRSGRTAERPELKACMNYLREGDTLIISRLHRLARSVWHLSQLAEQFEKEAINLLVLDQNIDTSTSTSRLMFNMLASIAEFENELRTEQQSEGIAKAKENGVRFGRPPKLTGEMKKSIYSRRLGCATIGQLAKEFSLGEASIYQTINAVKQSGTAPEMKTTKVILPTGGKQQ